MRKPYFKLCSELNSQTKNTLEINKGKIDLTSDRTPQGSCRAAERLGEDFRIGTWTSKSVWPEGTPYEEDSATLSGVELRHRQETENGPSIEPFPAEKLKYLTSFRVTLASIIRQ
jgi:hypothetical protein